MIRILELIYLDGEEKPLVHDILTSLFFTLL